MTDNDYIAEYVKEERPEILKGRKFFEWKLKRFAADAATEISRFIHQAMSEDSSKAAAEEENNNDRD